MEEKIEKEDIEELVYKFIGCRRLNKKQRTDIYEELCREIIKNNIPETQYKIMATKNSIDIIINLKYISIESLLTILVIADYLPQ
jgi:hypothetical protein